MKLKIYYKIKNKRITSWIKMREEGYYVFDDVWIVRGGNKRGSIKQALENHLNAISHHTNYPPCDSPFYHTEIDSETLITKLTKFRLELNRTERNLIKELERLKNESFVGVRE